MKVIERVKNNKTLLILFFLILLCLILMLFRLTKSYLDSKIEDEQEVDVDVTAQQTDDLKFIEGNPLSLNVNPTTLPQNGSNLVSTTHPRVELLANDATNSASYTYSIYVHISNNTFTYSDGSTPEILLSITNPNNAAITSLNGYNYVTQNGVSGFDVTNYNGYIAVATDYAIESTSSTTPTVQNWTFTLTYLNLNIDQSNNIGKYFDIEIMFVKNSRLEIEYASCTNPSITNTYFLNCDNSLLACRVAHDFDYNSLSNSKVILHNGLILGSTYWNSCDILDANDDSYRYTGGEYKVTQQAISAGYNYVNTYNTSLTHSVIGVKCNGTDQFIGSYCYSTSLSSYNYYLLYDTNNTPFETYNEAVNKAIEDGYIVSRNINNYVCFGYDRSVLGNETICPEQNLYRIIGAFDDDKDGNYEVKLIKDDYATSEQLGANGASSYNDSYNCDTYYRKRIASGTTFRFYGDGFWDQSTFRTNNLNNYFINTYLKQGTNGTYWTSMIPEKNWYSASYSKTVPYYFEYNNERNGNNTTITNNYVGLLTYSDYLYTTSNINNKWASSGVISQVSTYNWLYNGKSEWTLEWYSNNNGNSRGLYLINDYGNDGNGSTSTELHSARPVFYLNDDIEVAHGTGTKTDPYYLYNPS